MTPAERSLRARKAAHTRWAGEDPKPNAARATAGLLARFERDVDPEGTLAPDERNRRALHARKAHMAGLALKSAQARRKRSGAA